ncbi:unnamed protein product [Spirodela intermedia]|uniref:Uncharacterized protein n=2 Tax=Spirodela intermedia TaxID=51605 RepID=A0A7I8L8D1_SPIIN|nr:unnamed protein product [Spirodela intermedia]CAA6669335.1 unnamed protein product [Spirodela intermedia]CAA7406283.1 unnamed protein product [Spirodela intermedia]
MSSFTFKIPKYWKSLISP